MLGIGLGLGCWLTFMLAPLIHFYDSPIDPQVGSALVLLYPLAIAYATVRYRLFDATVVIRRSVVYTMLAGLITGAYALLLAGANALAGPGRLDALALVLGRRSCSSWSSLFNPLRERVRRAVDRTFFRERYDYARTIQALARSMSSLLDLDEITRRLTTTIESAMHVRAARLLLGGLPPTSSPSSQVAPGALSRYQLAADPRFAPGRAPALAAYAALDAEVVVPLRFQDELRGAPGAGPQALGGGLHRRGPRAARDGGRPGGGGGRQRRGAPARARLRAGARAEPADPHQPRQVRPAARAPAHRGVAGGARRSTSARRTSRCSSPTSPATRGSPRAWRPTTSTRSSSATSAPSSTRSSSTAATSTRRRATGSW